MKKKLHPGTESEAWEEIAAAFAALAKRGRRNLSKRQRDLSYYGLCHAVQHYHYFSPGRGSSLSQRMYSRLGMHAPRSGKNFRGSRLGKEVYLRRFWWTCTREGAAKRAALARKLAEEARG